MQKEVKENKKIYINNCDLMQFIDDIATEATLDVFKDTAEIEINDGLSDSKCIVFTELAQDYYNDFYNGVETSLNNILNIYSDNELL